METQRAVSTCPEPFAGCRSHRVVATAPRHAIESPARPRRLPESIRASPRPRSGSDPCPRPRPQVHGSCHYTRVLGSMVAHQHPHGLNRAFHRGKVYAPGRGAEGEREELAKQCEISWLCDCAPLLTSLLAAQSDPLVVWEWRPHVCSSSNLVDKNGA